jgi:MoaA/NifB/PqqE/SkfB family radical SAM enzyme
MSRTAILYVTERCNQACVFCLEEDGTALRPDVAPEQVRADLAALRAAGAEHITFMGGETFLRKDLPELLGEARRAGFTRLGVTTNGTALAHPGFLGRMIDAGLDFVELSVHSDDAALAEEISGKAFTFERQERAIAELEAARERLQVIVNLVVCRENHRRVAAILERLLDAHPRLAPTVKIKFVSVIGAAATHGAPLRYDEVDLQPALALLRARGVDYWLYNFPLCRVDGEAARSHEAQAFVLDWRYSDYDHRRRDGYYDSGHQLEGNVWPERSCARCALAPICPGLEETYRRACGDGELAPRADDPLPTVAQILARAGRDESEAPALLARLSARRRPTRFVPEVVPRPGEAAVAFARAGADAPLWFELQPADPARPAFARGRLLQLSYRTPLDGGEPGSDPDGRALLEAMARALADADAAAEPPARAAARLASSAPTGWRPGEVRLGPPPPSRDAPLAISIGRRPR